MYGTFADNMAEPEPTSLKQTSEDTVEIIDYETKFGIFTEFNLSDSLSTSSNYDYTKPVLLEKFVFLLPKYKRRLLEKRIPDLTKKRESK